MARTGEDSSILYPQCELHSSENSTKTDRSALVTKVFTAITTSLGYVIRTTTAHINRKRKTTEDDSVNVTKAKKSKPNFEECVVNDDSNGDNECSICLEPWSAMGGHRVASLKCGHLFGLSCIIKWIEHAHICPKCCALAEVSDLREIFAEKITAEDTSQRDIVIKLLEDEKTARTELLKQLAKQRADNIALRLELNLLKRQFLPKKKHISAGFGLSSTITAIKNCLSWQFSKTLKSRYKIMNPPFFESVHENRCKLPDKGIDAKEHREIVQA